MALAEFGVYEVQSRIKLLLPQGRVKVCRDALPWDASSNKYTWDCHTGSGIAPIVVKLGWRELQDGMPAGDRPATNPQLVMLVQS
jgi:type IV pilus assembly protein PilV